ncbi:MAG: carbohydrate kinase [Bacteroidales bacterium]|nr:carbohydrate kinase [Bacteroidales bacterium]
MYLLGYDIGSSSVKASLIDAQSGVCLSTSFFPRQEMPITALQTGWAEQDPNTWWENLKASTQAILAESRIDATDIAGIGISYQMHGLVLTDKHARLLRPAIIWCDSRAVPYGEKAFREIGEEKCLSHLLNSPGNFTASKLAWVKEHEPEIFDKIDKFMLPGDYIALRLTGECTTTASGLSEGILWDFTAHRPAQFLMDYFGFSADWIPEILPSFAPQGQLSRQAAEELGLKAGTPVCYRGGDQPNNALSLNVLNPGEVAATAGTSGVVYGVNGHINYDPKSRVNSFAHVNHTKSQTRIGVLLCINGTGITNAWMKRNSSSCALSYAQLNEVAAQAPIGCDGLSILPFGNGSERMFENKAGACSIHGLQFNRHGQPHLLRAVQEGVVFAFAYGMEIMNSIGIETKLIRAGKANMFLNPVFRDTLAGLTGACIELYNTDGSIGAARGAGLGAGIYKDAHEAFASLQKVEEIFPVEKDSAAYREAYLRWKSYL